MSKVIGEIKVEITESDIESIIVGSLEGGSSYWLGLDNTGEDWEVNTYFRFGSEYSTSGSAYDIEENVKCFLDKLNA